MGALISSPSIEEAKSDVAPRRGSYQLIMIAAALALSACGTKPTAVIERHVEPCPLAVEPPDCPDFPDHSGKPWEVVLDERDLTYARCRGWAETFWKARQECGKKPAR